MYFFLISSPKCVCVFLWQCEDEAKYEGWNCVIVPIGGPPSRVCFANCLPSSLLQYWNEYPAMTWLFTNEYNTPYFTKILLILMHNMCSNNNVVSCGALHSVLIYSASSVAGVSGHDGTGCVAPFEYSKQERPWANVSPHPTSCVLRKRPFLF